MRLRELSAALSPTEVVGDDSVEIADLAYAAGGVRPGSLFFCVAGSRADGHDFAPAALEHGAVALAVERRLPLEVPQVVLEDTRAAMPAAAAAFFGHPTRELEVAGVTGTTGKTTTTYLLYAVLEAAGRRPGLMGTVESRIGGERKPAVRTTPEAIDLQRAFRAMLDAGDRSVALEATSHGSELGRLAGVRFAALAFTNLTEEHLDFHGTMERYYAAKRRLFVGADPPPAAVNVGDPTAASWPRSSAPSGARRYSPTASPTTPRSGPTASRAGVSRPAASTSRRDCAGASTSRTCSPPSPSGSCSTCRTRRSQPGSPAWRASPAASRPSTRASRSRSSWTTRTSRARSSTCSERRRSWRRAGCCASSAAAGTGTGPSVR